MWSSLKPSAPAARRLTVLDQVLAAGVKIVQLREKDLADRALYELAREFRRRTEAAGSLLIIDDRVDIALAAGADGVHLGQTDLPVAAARRIAPDLIVGASGAFPGRGAGGPGGRGRIR